MLNIVDLINHLRSYPENVIYVIDQLWVDFYFSISDDKGKIFLGAPQIFIGAVNKTIKHMDVIYNSIRTEKCKYIWASVFSKIRNIAINYYIWIVDNKFLNLEFRYSPEKIIVTEVRNEALIFLGLKQGFTKEELIRTYRQLVLKMHPDKGGRVEDFRKLQVYKEQLERSFN